MTATSEMTGANIIFNVCVVILTFAAGLVYRHVWRPRDLVIWDSRSTIHCAIADYEGTGERYMHRTTALVD